MTIYRDQEKFSSKNSRLLIIDSFRGIFVLWMVFFHFFWDLSFFNILRIPILSDPFWYFQRNIIVFGFVIISGFSFALKFAKGDKSFSGEIKLLLSSVCVSLASYILSPTEFIYFGVLHFIFLAKILSRLIMLFNRKFIILMIFILISIFNIKMNFFNSIYLNWVGLNTKKPITMDYVPLFPWIGVYFTGIAFGFLLVKKELYFRRDLLNEMPAFKNNFLFLFLGKRSLLIYLLHQPIIIGFLKIFIFLKY